MSAKVVFHNSDNSIFKTIQLEDYFILHVRICNECGLIVIDGYTGVFFKSTGLTLCDNCGKIDRKPDLK